MAERVTIFEVARRAGVSASSVSRALEGKPGVSPLNRQLVMAAVKELGYVPNGSARGLATSRHGVIGLLFPGIGDDDAEAGHEVLLYADQVIRGAERAAQDAGYAVLIAGTRGPDSSGMVRSVAGKADGLVVLARSIPQPELMALARRAPVVLLAAARPVPGADLVAADIVAADIVAADLVAADNEAGAYDVTNHLLAAHGYRDVIFAGGPEDSPDSQARFAGFQRAMRANGLAAPARPEVDDDFSEAGGTRIASQLLRRNSLPRAIVVANDQMAVGLSSALGVKVDVPGDVALTGFDDIQLSRFSSPPLTTVRQPMQELGSRSVSLLLDRIEGASRGAPRTVLLPTTLVVRRSCGCQPAAQGPASST
jgi:LacI family transcriptional regulator